MDFVGIAIVGAQRVVPCGRAIDFRFREQALIRH
jgi:hypothetical protein